MRRLAASLKISIDIVYIDIDIYNIYVYIYLNVSVLLNPANSRSEVGYGKQNMTEQSLGRQFFSCFRNRPFGLSKTRRSHGSLMLTMQLLQ